MTPDLNSPAASRPLAQGYRAEQEGHLKCVDGILKALLFPSYVVVLRVLPEACLRRTGFLKLSARSYTEQHVVVSLAGLRKMMTPRKPPSSTIYQIIK
jgi:hypothetical protein